MTPTTGIRLAVLTSLIGATVAIAHGLSNRPSPASPHITIPAITPDPLRQAPRIEAVFVLDTTGSMSGLIEGAKAKVWSIANQLSDGEPQPRIRLGLVGYRDRGDAYVTKRFDLTDDIDTLYGHLTALSADGGGDTPESVNQALHESVAGMSWSESGEAYRVVFLVGDAPPHMDYQDDISHFETLKAASRRDIIINTVQCGQLAETTPIWRQIAKAGEGRFIHLPQDGAMQIIETPMDGELARWNQELTKTIVAWGSKLDQAEIAAKQRRAQSASKSVASSRLSYLNKNGATVNSGRRDLVDAIDSGLDLDEVDKKQLPPELASLTEDERRRHLDDLRTRRSAINRRIRELVAQRDAYIRAETERLRKEGSADGFDEEVLTTIRKQAKSAGISY